VPEDFKTYINRLIAHAEKHFNLLKDALSMEEYETADFMAQIVVLDLTKLREVINARLIFSKKQS